MTHDSTILSVTCWNRIVVYYSILGMYWDDGKETGNYHNESHFRGSMEELRR